MASVFGVGIATVDIINCVATFPKEDSEVRAISQHTCRGGNVCNTLTVLSQLGHKCYWSGVICSDSDSHYILDDLRKHNIDYSNVQNLASGKVPTSYITLNQENGSRSIVHYRDLPELSYAYFKTLKLPKCDWYHFEARAINETLLMVKHVRNTYPEAKISIEIEKQREDLDKIFNIADLYLFSHAFANTNNFDSPDEFLKQQKIVSPTSDLTCTWGDQGAAALLVDGTLLHSPAFPPKKIVDTLGAGDTFNAAIIHGLMNELDWQEFLRSACKLAGKKCGQQGFSHLL